MDDPTAAATASSAFAWRRTLAAVGAHAEKEREQLVRRRVEEMEAAVACLRAEKEAAEGKAAALREELESERGFAEAAASEAMLMIGRLQREKSAAMIEAREFQCIVEGRAGRDEEIEEWLQEAYGLASSYRDRLRAHGIDPDDDGGEGEGSEAAVNGDDNRSSSSSTGVKGVVVEEPLPTPLRQTSAAEELKIRAGVTTKAVAEAGDLCARVAALEANSAAAVQGRGRDAGCRRAGDGETALLGARRLQVVLLHDLTGNKTLGMCGEGAPASWIIRELVDVILPPLAASTPGKIQGYSAYSEQKCLEIEMVAPVVMIA